MIFVITFSSINNSDKFSILFRRFHSAAAAVCFAVHAIIIASGGIAENSVAEEVGERCDDEEKVNEQLNGKVINFEECCEVFQ